MRIGLVLVGEELLDGRIADRNGVELGALCRVSGASLVRIVVVGDEVAAIADAVRDLASQVDLVVTSGGLGPTLDDASRQGLASAAGVALEESPEQVARLERVLGARGFGLNAANRRQALMPVGAVELDNPDGTANGFMTEAVGTPVLSLPGVPSEFRRMLALHVGPRLEGREKPETSRLLLFGIGESDIAGRVEGLALPGDVRVTYCARFPVTEVELQGSAAVVADASARLREVLGPWEIPGGVERPAEALVSRCLLEGLTVATAESCTGGLIASQITDVAGASGCFTHGWVTYGNVAKAGELGVPLSVIDAHGAVSREVVREMVIGARRMSGSDLAVAVSGVAGPGGGSSDKPVGTVHLASTDGREVLLVHAQLRRLTRAGFRRKAAFLAEMMLLRQLAGESRSVALLSGVEEVVVSAVAGGETGNGA